VLEHQSSELRFSEHQLHCALQDVNLFEEKHHIQLFEHFFSGLVEEGCAFPMQLDTKYSENCVYSLYYIEEQVIPSKSVGRSFLGHVKCRSKVELE